uniref:Carbohydrate kinase family protein n=1 Tax=Thermofilum pendens TaxID=2269 RepID=A0A7J3X8Z8_THEPE
MARVQLVFAVAGNLNVDQYLLVERIPGPDEAVEVLDTFSEPGGAATNVAVALARLGAGVRLLGFVGLDDAGSFLLHRLSSLPLDLRGVRRVEKPTGRVFVVLDRSGRRAMLALRGANAELKPGSFEPGALEGVEHLHLSSTKPAFSEWMLAEAKKAGLTTSYDPGSAVASEGFTSLEAALRHVDVLLVNERELRMLGLKNLKQEFRGLLVVKKGPLGSEAPFEGLSAPAFKVDVVDTTGAGDAFNAAFLVCWKLGMKLGDCLLLANAAGALKACRYGAQSSPTLEELLAFLSTRGLEELAARVRDAAQSK